MANPIEDDEETFEPGCRRPGRQPVYVRAFADRNRVTTSLERMDALRPPTAEPDWSDYDRRAVESEAIL